MSRIEELEAELALVSELIEKYEELKQIKGRTAIASSQYIPNNNDQLYIPDNSQLYTPEYNHVYIPEYNHLYRPEYNHVYDPEGKYMKSKNTDECPDQRLYPSGEPFMAFTKNPLFHYHPESYRDVVLVYNGQILDYKKPDKKDVK